MNPSRQYLAAIDALWALFDEHPVLPDFAFGGPSPGR